MREGGRAPAWYALQQRIYRLLSGAGKVAAEERGREGRQGRAEMVEEEEEKQEYSLQTHTHSRTLTRTPASAHACTSAPCWCAPDQGPGCHYSFPDPLQGETIGCRAGSSPNQGGVNFQVQIKVGPLRQGRQALGHFFFFFFFPLG